MYSLTSSTRRIAATILSLMILLGSLLAMVPSSQAASFKTGQYQVTPSNGVNVRAKATTNSNIVGAATKGTRFTVSKVSGDWGYTTQISCTNGRRKGWVCLQYAKLVKASSGSGNSSQKPSAASGTYNPKAALKFAAKHVYTDPGWWCAEYVARCIKAGGINMPVRTYVDDVEADIIKYAGAKRSEMKVRSDGYIYAKDNKKAKPGDVVVWECARCDSRYPGYHIVLVSSVNAKDGRVHMYAHNNASDNKPMYLGHSCGRIGRAYLLHIG